MFRVCLSGHSRFLILFRSSSLAHEIFDLYNTFDPASKSRNILAWKPVIVMFLNSVQLFDDEQVSFHRTLVQGDLWTDFGSIISSSLDTYQCSIPLLSTPFCGKSPPKFDRLCTRFCFALGRRMSIDRSSDSETLEWKHGFEWLPVGEGECRLILQI